jgi:DNA-binding transcriptional ArsR family regulator
MTRTRQTGDRGTESHSDQAIEILELLGDPTCRTILRETSDQPRTADELESLCDASLSSVYRKTENLSAVGLLDERTRISTSGKHTNAFVSAIDEVTVTFAPGGTLDISTLSTVSENRSPQTLSAD